VAVHVVNVDLESILQVHGWLVSVSGQRRHLLEKGFLLSKVLIKIKRLLVESERVNDVFALLFERDRLEACRSRKSLLNTIWQEVYMVYALLGLLISQINQTYGVRVQALIQSPTPKIHLTTAKDISEADLLVWFMLLDGNTALRCSINISEGTGHKALLVTGEPVALSVHACLA
jgi:hypothetical protein